MKTLISILRTLLVIAIVITTAKMAQSQTTPVFEQKQEFPALQQNNPLFQQTAIGADGTWAITGGYTGVAPFIYNGTTYSSWAGITLVSTPPTEDWGDGIGILNNRAITIDGAGNKYVIHPIDNTSVIINGITYAATNYGDDLLVKYSPTGVKSVIAHLKSSYGMSTYTMAVDDSTGDIYVGGAFKDSLVIGTTTAMVSVGNTDGFLIKISSTGAFLWGKVYGDANDGDQDDVHDIKIDPKTGDIFVSGAFEGTVNFGSGSANTQTSYGYEDIFVAWYTSAGTCVKTWQVGGTHSQEKAQLSITDSTVAIIGRLSALTTVYDDDGTIGDTMYDPRALGHLDFFAASFSRSTGDMIGCTPFWTYTANYEHFAGIGIVNNKIYLGFSIPAVDTVRYDLQDMNQYVVGGGFTLFQLDSACSVEWIGSYGNGISGRDIIAIDSTDRLYIAFDGASADIDFGTGTVSIGSGDNIVQYFVGTYALSLSDTIDTVFANADSLSLGVTSNESWSASENCSWVSISPSLGTGNDSITITYQQNFLTIARTCAVTVLSNSGLTETFVLTQDGALPALSLSSSSVSVNAPAGTTTVNVVSNIPWSVTGTESWYSVSPASGSGNATLTVTYTANGDLSSKTDIFSVEETSGSLSENFTLNQAGADTLTTTTTPDGEICSGLSKTLSTTSSGGIGNYSHSWSSDPVGFTSSAAIVSVSPALTTTYYVTVTSGNQSVTDTVIVIVNVNPTADFEADSVTSVGGVHNFTDLSVGYNGATIVGWNWDFGDGNTSTQQNPTHTYANGGTYDAEETVMDSKGCYSSLTKLNYISTSVGIEDIEGFSFSIYPNPTSDVINIESSKQIQEVKLFNSAGQLIRVTNENLLNVQDLVPGVYILHIILENGFVSTTKIVKQ